MMNMVVFIAGPWLIILTLKAGIDECKKLGDFLKIIYSNDKRKHTKKAMMISLVKYLIFLFVLTIITYQVLAVYLVLAWLVVLYLSSFYVRLWKYQGLSLVLLIVPSAAVIALTVLLGDFVRQGFWFVMQNAGSAVMILAAVGLTVYTIFSKQDEKSVNEMDRFRKWNINRILNQNKEKNKK